MPQPRFFLLASILLAAPVISLPAADKDLHGFSISPEMIGLPHFHYDFQPCWHDDFPFPSLWPDGTDFLTHVTDKEHRDRMDPTLCASLRVALERARRRTFQNPAYVVNSCYYHHDHANPQQSRWIQNFLIPLCSDEHSPAQAFCTAWNEWPYQKRTILSIEQAEAQLRVCCFDAQLHFTDLVTRDWQDFCTLYPCRRRLCDLPDIMLAKTSSPPAVLRKNVAALIKLQDYLNGCTLTDEELYSSLSRLDLIIGDLRSGAITNSSLTVEEVRRLIVEYNAIYNDDGEGSPISIESSDDELFDSGS